MDPTNTNNPGDVPVAPAANPTVGQVPGTGTGVPGTMPPAPVTIPDPTQTPVVDTPTAPVTVPPAPTTEDQGNPSGTTTPSGTV